MEWHKYLAKLTKFDQQCGQLTLAHKKIKAAQATVKAYSMRQIPPTSLPKLSFSEHYLELHMLKHPELFALASCLADLRQTLIENFGVWHVFSQVWLTDLKKELQPGKSLVLMCGNAILAAQLPDAIAVDDLDWQKQDNTTPRPWRTVEKMDALLAVEKYCEQVDNIILEWAPEQTTCDTAILAFLRTKKWAGKFIVIGERQGATNSQAFWQQAQVNAPPSLNVHHQPFDFISDRVYVVT
ncbi:MAG: hypothetical protein HDT50_03325 [Lactobacillus sp.]|nr:hypothetical protein [Lactobacillus sp.]MBD5069212.1 hypothetical protein [Lactobacillus sp.]